ncbi:hypothetical protein QU487_06155 [Crenobacter sp. SG2305]|uniref:hypothetical protein n=1 Tax=Crenobacter oryzisoli TaxID=3056844 RepID=UPI0025AB4E88|nr:hypothetical protein [Crenobacter sp. SG2305]MDN0082334.1 hypothetical protein [Crenobacter sp. SG2305]
MQRTITLAPLLERRESLRPVGFVLAGLAVGGLAWIVGLTAAAGLFPLVWLLAKTRKEAALAAFSYYLIGSWTIPGAAGAFFGPSYTVNLGLGLWLLSSAVLSVPWVVARRSFLGLILALLLVSLPPIGLIGWLNPVLSAGDLFPGAGFAGMAALLCLWAAFSRPSLPKRRQALAVVTVAAMSVLCNATYSPRPVPSTWKAVNTQLGKFPTNLMEAVDRQIKVIDVAQRALNSGAQLVLLPEQVTGWFDDSMLSVWTREFAHFPWRNRQMLLVGAERPITPGGKEYRNALGAWIQGDFLGYVSARQTVPVSMWKPWDRTNERAPADWFKLNMMPVPLGSETKLVATVFCFEELLVFPLFSTLALESPYAILSVVNGWWASPDEHRLQRQHIEAWAKLFNLPLLRAVNQ